VFLTLCPVQVQVPSSPKHIKLCWSLSQLVLALLVKVESAITLYGTVQPLLSQHNQEKIWGTVPVSFNIFPTISGLGQVPIVVFLTG
jgi:hypothetical protein